MEWWLILLIIIFGGHAIQGIVDAWKRPPRG